MAQPLKNIEEVRYSKVSQEKSEGETYTPEILANFVAKNIVAITEIEHKPIRLLDPAIGDGELIISILRELSLKGIHNIEVHAFETNESALNTAIERIEIEFPNVKTVTKPINFLEFVLSRFGINKQQKLFEKNGTSYDLIIANPPYVRTQIIGATQAQKLVKQFGLSGRVDLYYPFLLGMARVLSPNGVAGIIVSNRFMTTKSGASVRKALKREFKLIHIWDLGDTKLFDAAVLPAVILAKGKNGTTETEKPLFTSIYQTKGTANHKAVDQIEALAKLGVVKIDDGRCFNVQKGELDTSGSDDGVWRVGNEQIDTWLATVEKNTWGTFRDIGKIRVGVKTCADKVFISDKWGDIAAGRPELLVPITTHYIARRFKALQPDKEKFILYPHVSVDGKRNVVNIEEYPRSKEYLENNRERLEGRKYVIDSGRNWYEIWVPQNPADWKKPKLIFRDISEQPTFWIDLNGSIVNGDCYWLTCNKDSPDDLLWLALAVGNSSFIELFYDHKFNNKLYAGRRRFITQYVQKFPLPNPNDPLSREIISNTKSIYQILNTNESETLLLEKELDRLVWKAFGLGFEEVSR